MGGKPPERVATWSVTLMQLAADFCGGSDFSHKFDWAGQESKKKMSEITLNVNRLNRESLLFTIVFRQSLGGITWVN